MLNIAICDDNNEICSTLEEIILSYSKTSLIDVDVEVFYSGESLISYIQNNNNFDLIFLDIELKSTTGIEVGRKIRKDFDDNISKIVFITAKNGYAEQLFDIQPLNFLRKPINETKVIECMILAIKILNLENTIFKYKSSKDTKVVKYADIYYFESMVKRIKIVSSDGEDYFYSNLKYIKKSLPISFLSPHRSYIVNYNNVSKITNNEMYINAINVKIPISRRKLSEIQKMQSILEKENI